MRSCLQSPYCNVFDCASGTMAQKGFTFDIMQGSLERDGYLSLIFAIKCNQQTTDCCGFCHYLFSLANKGRRIQLKVSEDSEEGRRNVLHLLSYQSMPCIPTRC